MSLLLRLSRLSLSRVSPRTPIPRIPPTPLARHTLPYSDETSDSTTESDQFKDAHFIECCVRNESSSLPPHLQAKYLPKSIVNRMNRRKEHDTIRDKGEDWTALKQRIANLSNKTGTINLHIDNFPKDKKAKANRRIIKFKRKKLFRYLKRMDFPLYEQLKEKYQLEEIDILIDKETFLNRHLLVAKAKAERKAKHLANQTGKETKV